MRQIARNVLFAAGLGIYAENCAGFAKALRRYGKDCDRIG